MDETDIDDGEWQAAAVNEGAELKHSRLLHRTLERMEDTMVLVPSSCGTIYRSKVVTKYVYRNDENRHFITVKYVNDHPKWADDDRTDWTMKSADHTEDVSMHTLRQCRCNDVSHVTLGALLREQSVS